VGRNPLQLLMPAYWRSKVSKRSIRKYGRQPLNAQETHDACACLTSTDPDVRRETGVTLQGKDHHGARLVIHHLEKTFDLGGGRTHKAVAGFSVRLCRGQIFCLLGHNGAGKSTTINCITGV
ncbi:ABC transporter A, ABCA, partial [Kipferlia bialata]